MKTPNDTLSFEDLQVYNNMLVDSVTEIGTKESMNGLQIANFINKERPKLIGRFVHTFLEWDTYDESHHSDWTLNYVSASQNISSLISTAYVNTIKEAEIIAVEKISSYLGIQIHLEYDDCVKDELYKVIGKNGSYQGMVEIKRVISVRKE